MTNSNETNGSPDHGDLTGRERDEHAGLPGHDGITRGAEAPGQRTHKGADTHAGRAKDIACTAYGSHGGEQQVTLRTPAELADALPYLLGYHPEDSIVLVALYDKDGRGRFGGRARLGIPANRDDWPAAARQLAQGLVAGSERRGVKPEQMVVFLCQEPGEGEPGQRVRERLGPLAHALRLECGALDVPVVEALCISDGRFWSYCCDDEGCCPVAGTPMGLPGTSVLAAAATYAGLQVRGTLRELRARFLPWENAAALEQEAALDAAHRTLVPKILDAAGRNEVARQTRELASRVMDRLAGAPSVSGMLPADLRDDELLRHDEAAALILGLQDRTTRDRAAEWMEGAEAAPALRLWRALARRCVGSYGEHAAAPLTLAGWVAWSTGDELEAREALAMALGADPDYLFARLLHQACNEGLDPESIRRCLRAERDDQGKADGGSPVTGAGGGAGSEGPDGEDPEAGEFGDTEPGTAGEPVVFGPGADMGRKTSSRHRRRERAPGAGAGTGGTAGGLPRRERAGGDRPAVRIPHPRTAAGGTGPGGVRSGVEGPDAARRRRAAPRRGRTQIRSRGGAREE
ncbi:DUF4192 domain-containing protein [Streptomyces sp. MAR25Y5]|uniref:DUF4192 domain-containing protein n=1 Tax=Streptomyces sp. MAR25Y5 TaxID=2962028 RepID=UPI0020B771BC|nr:DUF4192 domain-containing protein [Streptomyces sp. MAR25Y5]MCP3769041.1 DUF4192 domain-containing protein [Streptomyces sp. MAR25Y5]